MPTPRDGVRVGVRLRVRFGYIWVRFRLAVRSNAPVQVICRCDAYLSSVRCD